MILVIIFIPLPISLGNLWLPQITVNLYNNFWTAFSHLVVNMRSFLWLMGLIWSGLGHMTFPLFSIFPYSLTLRWSHCLPGLMKTKTQALDLYLKQDRLHLQIINQTVWYMLQTFNEVYLRKFENYFHFMKPVVMRLCSWLCRKTALYGRVDHVVYTESTVKIWGFILFLFCSNSLDWVLVSNSEYLGYLRNAALLGPRSCREA